jgi:polyisoprenoid-binding protein YceI
MKQFLFAMTAGVLILTSCQTAPDADKAATAEQQEAASAQGASYSIDVAGSTIGWIGTKVGGQHNGTFNLAEGSLVVSEGNLAGGNFSIDMTSVTVLDLQDDNKPKLEGHLKSADFFAVDSFPKASFEITDVKPFDAATMTSKLEGATHLISGNLTMRGATKNVTFPAIVTIEGNQVMAQADFNIDRSEWGVNFKGPNNPADWVIAKEVNLKLDVKATGGSL